MTLDKNDLAAVIFFTALATAVLTLAITATVITVDFQREAVAAGAATFVREPDPKGSPVFKWLTVKP